MARVLVVDDQNISRVTLTAMLEEAGHEVASESGGIAGLKRAREWAPDVIVLDINMPDLDGFEVMSRLNEDPETAAIPVIFLTAEAPDDDLIVRGLDLGAYDFLGKGGSKAELLARVGGMARIKRSYDELAAIARISDTLIRTVDPGELCRLLVEQTREVFRADGAFLAMREPGEEARIMAEEGIEESGEVDRGIADLLLDRLGTSADESVVLSAEAAEGATGDWMRARDYTSGVVAYVPREDQAATLLAVFARKPEAFRLDSDATLLHTLARQATVALDKALLHAETRRQTAKLREQAAKLEEAMTERSRFFASMSHEIRTPINAVIGYNQLLDEGIFGALAEPQLEAVRNVNRSAQHLLELVNDILDISKIEAGKFEIANEPVDLPELVRDTATSVQLQARQKDLRLEVEAPEHLHITADAARIRQILLNLLSNAVKFTEEGGVTVTVLETGVAEVSGGGASENGGGEGVEVRVQDTGPGIAREDRERIFSEFEQVARAGAREGTGLGLAISRKLARMMGGDLELHTEVGVGSTFILRLPRTAPEGGELPRAPGQEDGGAPGG